MAEIPSQNMKLWNAWKAPPKDALKKIKGGRLSGMTDISPQWRLQALTEQLGPCGEGWKYEIVQLWTEKPIEDGVEVCAFARVDLYVGIVDVGWSDPIPGIGGSMLVAKEKHGPHVSDEAFKMAVTDALSVAMKALGVAADVYRGLADSSKYGQEPPPPPAQKPDVMTAGIEYVRTNLEKAFPAGLASWKNVVKECWDINLESVDKTGKLNLAELRFLSEKDFEAPLRKPDGAQSKFEEVLADAMKVE